MLKIYRSKKFMSLSVPLQVNDKLVIAEFKGGCVNPRVCGSYVTMDEGIQSALEKESGFNKDYFLEKTVNEDYQVATEIKAEELHEEHKIEEDCKGGEEFKGIDINEICRAQDAAEYLCERYGVKKIDVNSKAKIRAFIADKGIEFPKLNLGDGKE